MKPLSDLQAVLYQRKSTVSDGKSTRDQERENRLWCEANNIPVEKVFCDEGISASRYGKKARDAWQGLKAYLRPGHILVACEASRATRDLEEFVALRNLCTQHKIPLAYGGRVLDLTSGDDRFVGGLDFLLAERESEMIRQRVSRGMRGAMASGTPHGKPPQGYRSVPRRPGQRPNWEPDPIEAPRIQEAVARILNGESRNSVFKWMQSTGRCPASPSALKRLLNNPQLTGKRTHDGKVVGPATWPAIITEEQHHALVLRSKLLKVTPGPEPHQLCSGIAKCGKCGMGVRYRKSPSPRNPNPNYSCPQGCASRLASVVDKEVERAVLRRLRHINAADYSSENPAVAQAIRDIEALEADLAQWEERAIAGDVSAEMYAKVEKDRTRKIAELRPRTISPEQLNLMNPDKWRKASIKEKRDHVRALLNITIPPAGKDRSKRDVIVITLR